MYKFNGVMQYDLMSKDSNVKIECSYSTSDIHSINSFTVTDENGITYYFTLADKSTNGYDNDPNAFRNVTWMLTYIDIPARGHITYEYYDEVNIYTQNNIGETTYRVSRLMSEMMEDWEQKKFDVIRTFQYHCPRYRMRFLKSIYYGPTKVDFNYYADNQHMKEIVVSENNETIKKFSLTISDRFLTSLVFTGTNNEDKLEYGFNYQNRYMDLNDSIGMDTDYWGNICSSNIKRGIGNFNMYFNNEEYGGYLNQQELNNKLDTNNVARVINNEEDDPYYYYKVKLQSATNGDTRQPTPPEYHGVLSSITYPNGGHTTFTWENHRFPTATAADGDMVFDRRQQRIIEGGGFRIKSVKNYAADGTIASEDHYRYGFTYGDILQRNFPLPLPDTYNPNDHIGCGEAVVDPNLLTFMTFSYSKPGNETFGSPRQFQMMVVGRNSAVRQMAYIYDGAKWWDAYFSADNFRALLGGRHPVVYPEITVYHGDPDVPAQCNSKTVYKYDIYSYHHDPYTYYMSIFTQGTSLPDTAYFEGIYYYAPLTDVPLTDVPGLISDNYDAPKRHQLKSKSEYSYNATNGTWEQVSEEQYSYSEERIYKTGYTFNTYLSRTYRSNYAAPLANGMWLGEHNLTDFYIESNQCFGRSTMTGKNTTILRHGGTRTIDNTNFETFSYLYPGVQKSRDYSDLPYKMRYDYGADNCDKSDQYLYVGEINNSSDSVITAMKSRNMLASLISSETYTLLPSPYWITGSKINYGFFGNSILPSILYESNGDHYEQSMEILSYGAGGNPTEIVDTKTGVHSVFIWGSYGRYLIALIKNAELSQVQYTTSQLMAVPSHTRRTMLRTQIPNAQIQTWDYIPLIGVSAHTDVNGQTTLYEYDGLGRLKAEKRLVNGMSDPEILHKYEYNYVNQQ